MINNTPTSKSLLILLWNSDGILNHVVDLSLTLHDKYIDIAFISETHLTNRTKIRMTTQYSNQITAHGGGAAIII